MITAFFRTAILYLLLIVGLRLTGKRQIGELEPIELVLTMLLSDLASVPMQDFGIPPAYGGTTRRREYRRLRRKLSRTVRVRTQRVNMRATAKQRSCGRTGMTNICAFVLPIVKQ